MTREESRDRLKHLLDNIPKEPPTECDNEQEWLYENEEIRKAIETAIQSLSAEPCEDCISRQTTINYLCKNMCWYDIYGNMVDDDEQEKAITDLINGIPSVNPTRPKGKWMNVLPDIYRCSLCKKSHCFKTNFCPNCGADMRGDEDAD